MEKKKYEKPSMEVVGFDQQQLLVGSDYGAGFGGNYGYGYYDGGYWLGTGGDL